jgi:hypothetical protein
MQGPASVKKALRNYIKIVKSSETQPPMMLPNASERFLLLGQDFADKMHTTATHSSNGYDW